jgi:hypothetical protein
MREKMQAPNPQDVSAIPKSVLLDAELPILNMLAEARQQLCWLGARLVIY